MVTESRPRISARITAPATAPTTKPRTPDSTPTAVPSALSGAGLVMSYSAHEPPALRGVDVRIEPGEHVAIMGPSGSGKTTLLHVLAGIVRPTAGQVCWRGRDVGRLRDAERTRLRRTDFGFVFQSGHLLPELHAVENAALPLLVAGTPRAQAQALAASYFPVLGLSGLEGRRPGELSGGQAQRVAIARALVGNPAVVLADEPTGNLDRRTAADVQALMFGLNEQLSTSFLLVTHDPALAARCHRVLELSDGGLAQRGS